MDKGLPILQQLHDFTIQFARALITEDFDTAYAMTSASFRPTTSPARLRQEWRAIIPADWGPMTFLEAYPESQNLTTTLTDSADVRPEDQPLEVGWVYVGMAGDVYPFGEAIMVVVTLEGGVLRINDVEFGRP